MSPNGSPGQPRPTCQGGSKLTRAPRVAAFHLSDGLTPLLEFPQFTSQRSHLCSCPFSGFASGEPKL